MSIKPLTVAQQKRIIKNVVAACQDITKLDKTGYGFIYLASGFIAHYDLGGFIAYYSGRSLRNDIMKKRSLNMWDNFREGEQNYEYYMSKKAVYVGILEAIA